MAISLAHPYYDLPNLSEPQKYFQGYSFQLEMEGGALGVEERHSNHEIGNQPSHISEQNYQGFDNVIDFVDSPPDSKEAWEYVKAGMHGQPIIESQPISGDTVNRKRRMEWEPLDIPSKTFNNGTSSDTKISNLTSKEKDRKKSIQGRLGWADDIDLELSGDLSNNGYISEALLAFNTHLTVFKQEIPSPTHDAPKIPRSPQNSSRSITEHSINRQQNVQDAQHSINTNNVTENNTNNNSASNNNNNNNSNNKNSENVPQQISRSTTNGNNNNTTNNSNTNDNAVGVIIEQNNNLQQILQQNNYDAHSGGSSQCDSTFRKSDYGIDDSRFQYVLAAPTSIATKNNEESLTYLNQGQSYEIKLKKLGDLSSLRGKVLKSVIKICFHERRLQYMEKEQIHQWLTSRPGERIIEVDVPLSYGLCHVSQPLNVNLINTVEVHWDPMKEVGVYIKVNCISTEFTPKKHGGEKGVPFRIQVETYFENNQTFEGVIKPIHAAACQIKVFKLKGADRKHKQDREKIQKRPPSEQEKYQPSCECTILTDIPSESIIPQNCYSPEHVRPTVSPLLPASPVNMAKLESIIPYACVNQSGGSNINTNTGICKMVDQSMLSPQQADMDDFIPTISKDSTPTQLSNWLTYHRMSSHISSFSNFTGTDLLRMTKDDLVQICGLPDGIRLFNILHAKAITPRLTIYVSFDSTSYNAIYLHMNTTKELIYKLCKIPGFFENNSTINNSSNNVNNNSNNLNGNDNMFWGNNIQSKYSGSGNNLYDATKYNVYINGPSGIHVLVTDEVLSNIKDESLFMVDVQNNGKIVLKTVYKNEINIC